jgi:dolichol-phosphate mannosyltransferase
MKLSIIIPCYNEVENVPKLCEELLPVIQAMLSGGKMNVTESLDSAEMIFVDDGSTDDTSVRLKEHFSHLASPRLSFQFLKHEVNAGLGAAVRTGFTHAAGDILVTVDSDGTYKFSEIPALLNSLTPGVDIVTASPYHPQGGVIGVPEYRLFFSKGSSMLYRILVDRNIYTYTCLFRAYRVRVVREISFFSNDFLGGTELLVKAMLKGFRAADFPSVLHKRVYGVSKARIARTVYSHLKFMGWVLLQRLRLIVGARANVSV